MKVPESTQHTRIVTMANAILRSRGIEVDTASREVWTAACNEARVQIGAK